MLISPGNALAASLPKVTLGQAPRGTLKLTHKMDPLIRADVHVEPSGLLSGVTHCISAPGRTGGGVIPFSVIRTPGAHRPGCWRQAMLTFNLSLRAPSPFSLAAGLSLPRCYFSCTWVACMAGLCASSALYPSTRSLGSRSFKHSCRAGWESPMSWTSLCISRVWKQWALKEGGAPHMERPLLSPRCGGQGCGGDQGQQALPLLVCGCSSCLCLASHTFNMPSVILIRLVNQGTPEYFCLFKTHCEMFFHSLS